MKRLIVLAVIAFIGLAATTAHCQITNQRPILAAPLLLCAIAVIALREWLSHKK